MLQDDFCRGFRGTAAARARRLSAATAASASAAAARTIRFESVSRAVSAGAAACGGGHGLSQAPIPSAFSLFLCGGGWSETKIAE